jgi:hypothetical protein
MLVSIARVSSRPPCWASRRARLVVAQLPGFGTVFRITPDGVFTTVFSFDGTDGDLPEAGLVQGTDGALYGTTFANGDISVGTVFRLSVGLSPFVKTEPASGQIGSPVIILGNNLTGTTSVTFNGASATFKIVSDTEITTAVPVGATSGTVEVKTSSATLTSNVSFLVP